MLIAALWVRCTRILCNNHLGLFQLNASVSCEWRRMNLNIKREEENPCSQCRFPLKKQKKHHDNAGTGETMVLKVQPPVTCVGKQESTPYTCYSTSNVESTSCTYMDTNRFSSYPHKCSYPVTSTSSTACRPVAFALPNNACPERWNLPEPGSTAHVTHIKTEVTAALNLNACIAKQILDIEKTLTLSLQQLSFPQPVTHVYNPLDYAAVTHADYVYKYGNSHKKVLFLGMNPGPFGMAQNGVPFGVGSLVRDWLKVSGHVNKPANEHPKRPILGLHCQRDEVSGARFWGLIKKLCGSPEVFFQNCYVHNICPLVFMNQTGKNITPPQLPAAVRNSLYQLCDRALYQIIHLIQADIVIGVGKFAEERTKKVVEGTELSGVRVETIMHPSPANPAANKGWEAVAETQLSKMGVLPLLTCDN